jgi:hypothetical protein
MRRVQRDEVLDFETYGEQREAIRARALEIKAPRRIHLAGVLTFLFENAETVRYQILEMVRAERMVREADVRHELETYNELLGGPGELGCTLLVEISDPAERDARLAEWLELPEKVYVRLEDGERVRARFDERQRGDGRLSSVQYLKFDTRGAVPVAAGVDLPGLRAEALLDASQRQALREDLGV